MTHEEAKHLLLFHSAALPYEEGANEGFLFLLRPYGGVLPEAAYHEIVLALRVVAPALQKPEIDREIMSALWDICYHTRLWCIEPDGMLRRNGLIRDEDVATLGRWVDTLNWAISAILAGADEAEAFNDYDHPENLMP